MTEVSVDGVPTGERRARRLVEEACAAGDLAERHYLELKGALDLQSKKDLAKIAKFILGAANRDFDLANKAFDGHAVMIVGVAAGEAVGVVPVEMHELARAVERFTGPNGPGWDIARVKLDGDDREILLVIVDPPPVDKPPFVCHDNGDGMRDGAIYVRADGETREAKAPEVLRLAERATHRPTAVEVEVEVASIHAYEVDDDAVRAEYLETTKMRLRRAYMDAQAPAVLSEALGGVSKILFEQLSTLQAIGGMTTSPESRTHDEYEREIEDWENRVRQAWTGALDRLLGILLAGTVVRIANLGEAFLTNVELRLHLEGAVEALPWVDDEVEPRKLKLPSPPRAWGPTKTQRSYDFLQPPLHPPYMPVRIPSHPDIEYRNGGSVDLTVSASEIRPRGVYTSDDDECVLVVRDRALTQVEGDWSLTAQGYDRVFEGRLTQAVAAPLKFEPPLRKLLGLPG
jgi:hypothetical protein